MSKGPWSTSCVPHHQHHLPHQYTPERTTTPIIVTIAVLLCRPIGDFPFNRTQGLCNNPPRQPLRPGMTTQPIGGPNNTNNNCNNMNRSDRNNNSYFRYSTISTILGAIHRRYSRMNRMEAVIGLRRIPLWLQCVRTEKVTLGRRRTNYSPGILVKYLCGLEFFHLRRGPSPVMPFRISHLQGQELPVWLSAADCTYLEVTEVERDV